MHPGQLICEKYRLARRLGEGGMAEVWQARNELVGRALAIKFLLPTLARNREAVDRFVREARATAALRHPNIVDVFDAGVGPDGRPFIVMELLEGTSLEARLKQGALAAELTCAWLSQVARGLDAAHRAGIVHRDLSSANVFLVKIRDVAHPMPKILDFGVSKLIGPAYDGQVRTLDGAVLGSPQYMSPEQARGAESVDARTDVWALGVLLYECLSGRVPFTAKGYNALMLQIITAPHAKLSELGVTLDAELEALVEACLDKERERRPATVRLVAERLERLALRLAGRPLFLGRRATDRISLFETTQPPPPVVTTTLSNTDTLPFEPTWFSSGRRRSARTALVAVSAAIGGLVGVALGLGVAAASADARPAVPIASRDARPVVVARGDSIAATAPDSIAATVPVTVAEQPRNKAHDTERDLVTAAAESLGLRPPRAPHAPPPRRDP